ncbi:retrotransposon protein, putative, ty1-copia subclass [Tanacetum coccineum]
MARKPFPHQVERAKELPGLIHTDNTLTLQEASGNLTLQEASGSDVGLELLQEEDNTQPSENTSEQHDELHELGDLNEPPNYKAALSDPESDKWVEAMNAEMQSMKDNQVWCLVDLPPNSQLLGVNGFLRKRLINIRAIRILLAIAAYYDYDIWQMDVKTAFLNGHLSKDVYMLQPESRIQQNSSEPHWTAIKIILKYLRNTKDMVLIYGGNLKMSRGGVDWKSAKDSPDPRDDNVADSFTKLMPLTKHYEHALGIGLRRAGSLMQCMTSRSIKKLVKPFKEPEREFQSSGKLVRTRSLDYLSSPELNLFSDQEDQPKIHEKTHFELKGQFLKELHDNTFSRADNEDANEHIVKVLEIVDLFHIPEIKKVNERVYAAQVGCESCNGPYYTKDCPIKEDGKTFEEAITLNLEYHSHKEEDIEQLL